MRVFGLSTLILMFYDLDYVAGAFSGGLDCTGFCK